LQLHLLHESASRNRQEWECSAKNHISTKFKEIERKHIEMLEQERKQQRQLNVLAITQWQKEGITGWGMEEKVQTLSQVIGEVENFTRTGSKISKIIRVFEDWKQHVEVVHRERMGGRNRGTLTFVEGIGDEWKFEVDMQLRKLSQCLRQIEDIGSPLEESSLAAILRTCNAVLSGLSEELETVIVIERMAVKRERDWIENMLEAIGGLNEVAHTERRGVWSAG
jgi:hypothetical protein